MSSPDRSQSNNKGKKTQKDTEASGSGIAVPASPIEQELAMGMTLSTSSNVAVNNDVKQWLNNTQTPSLIDRPSSTQNQENIKLSDGYRPNSVDGSKPGTNALASRPLSNLGQPSIGARNNTPQPGDNSGTVTRARSAGDADGKRPQLGSRINTGDGGPLRGPSAALFQVERFQLGLNQRPSNGSSSPATDGLGNAAPEPSTANGDSPIPSTVLASSPQVPPRFSSLANLTVSGLPTIAVSTIAGYPIGTPAFSGNVVDNLVTAPNASEIFQDHHPSAAQQALEQSIGRAPSPPIIRQQAQHTVNPPIVPLPTAPGVVGESFFRSPAVQPAPDSVAEGIRLRAQDRASSLRPESRGKRIKRDLKQLWKDLFGHNPHTDMSTTHPAHHSNNELRTVCRNERQTNIGLSPLYQNNRLDGSLKGNTIDWGDHRAEREANVEPLDGEPSIKPQQKEDVTAPTNECTLSEASGNTAREGTFCGHPKNIFRRISVVLKTKMRVNPESCAGRHGDRRFDLPPWDGRFINSDPTGC